MADQDPSVFEDHDEYLAAVNALNRRERIAVRALAGLLANPNERNDSDTWPEAYAKVAIEAADALIKELDK